MPNYGKWCQYFRLGFQNNFHQNWPTVFRFIHWFLPADVANPILGINFFKQHSLVISPPTHQIVFSGSGIPPNATIATSVAWTGHCCPLLPAHQVSRSPPLPQPSWSSTTAAAAQVSPPVPAPPPLLPATGKIDSRVVKLLQEFPEIFYQPSGLPRPSHGVKHIIETTGRPVFAKPCRLDPDKLRVEKEEFAKLEAAGIIRSYDSPWSSPLHTVQKKNSSW